MTPCTSENLAPAPEELRSVDRREFIAHLRRLGKDGVHCRIDIDRFRTVTEYTLDAIVVARSICRQTPLGRIVEANYEILP